MTTIEPWRPDDLPLLRAVLGDPAMTEHLGGPEGEESLRARQARYVKLNTIGPGRVFRIHDGETPVGFVGYWDRDWQGEQVFEIGWSVLVEHQGHGHAKEATRLALVDVANAGPHRWVHAFPTPENAASNAICRSLGFELLGEVDFEYPKGTASTSNDWRFDLETIRADDG